MEANDSPRGWRAVYAHPAVQLVFAALQIYVALGLFGVVPGWSGTGNTFSTVLGAAFMLTAAAHIVSVVLRRAR